MSKILLLFSILAGLTLQHGPELLRPIAERTYDRMTLRIQRPNFSLNPQIQSPLADNIITNDDTIELVPLVQPIRVAQNDEAELVEALEKTPPVEPISSTKSITIIRINSIEPLPEAFDSLFTGKLIDAVKMVFDSQQIITVPDEGACDDIPNSKSCALEVGRQQWAAYALEVAFIRKGKNLFSLVMKLYDVPKKKVIREAEEVFSDVNSLKQISLHGMLIHLSTGQPRWSCPFFINTPGVDGVTVELDGYKIGKTPLKSGVSIEGGINHDVRLYKPGYREVRRTIRSKQGNDKFVFTENMEKLVSYEPQVVVEEATLLHLLREFDQANASGVSSDRGGQIRIESPAEVSSSEPVSVVESLPVAVEMPALAPVSPAVSLPVQNDRCSKCDEYKSQSGREICRKIFCK